MLLLHSQVDLVDTGLNVVPGQVVAALLSGCCLQAHQFIHVPEEHTGTLHTPATRLGPKASDITGLVSSPLCIFILHIAEASDGAGQLLPQGGSVSDVQRLVHQHHGRQHLHGNKQLWVGQRALQQTRHRLTSFVKLPNIMLTVS